MNTKQTALNLCSILGKIKDFKRTGWLVRNINNPESDADHMFSTTFLAMMFTPPELNKEKCLELALCHDLQEIYSGDFIPGAISASDKYQIERKAIEKLAQELDYPKLISLFEEFEAQATEEAKFTKLLDKLDTAVTACYYDFNHRGDRPLIEEFCSHAEEEIKKINSPYQNLVLDLLHNIKD